jgi:hypothetical protein
MPGTAWAMGGGAPLRDGVHLSTRTSDYAQQESLRTPRLRRFHSPSFFRCHA